MSAQHCLFLPDVTLRNGEGITGRSTSARMCLRATMRYSGAPASSSWSTFRWAEKGAERGLRDVGLSMCCRANVFTPHGLCLSLPTSGWTSRVVWRSICRIASVSTIRLWAGQKPHGGCHLSRNTSPEFETLAVSWTCHDVMRLSWNFICSSPECINSFWAGMKHTPHIVISQTAT